MQAKPHTIEIQRREHSKNSIMGDDQSWYTLHRSLKCNIQPITAKEQSFSKRESVEKEFRVFFDDHNVILDEKDKVVGKGRPLKKDEGYRIIGIFDWEDYFILRIKRWH